MSVGQIIVGWMLVAIVLGLFLHAIRVDWRLNDHRDHILPIQERVRQHDTRLYTAESKHLEMRREFQERFAGFDGDISNHETRLCAQVANLQELNEFHTNANALAGNFDRRLQRLEAGLERLDSLDTRLDYLETVLAGKATATGAPAWIVAANTLSGSLNRRIEQLESQAAPDWRLQVNDAYADHQQRLSQLETIINGVAGRIDLMQKQTAEWPDELRSEIAEAYRRMADAVENNEPNALPAYQG